MLKDIVLEFSPVALLELVVGPRNLHLIKKILMHASLRAQDWILGILLKKLTYCFKLVI